MCTHLEPFAFPPEQTLIICISTETFGETVCGMNLPCFISADMIIPYVAKELDCEQ